MAEKIGIFWIRKEVNDEILDRIEEKTGCELEVISFQGDKKKIEVYGDNNCRASMQRLKLLKNNGGNEDGIF